MISTKKKNFAVFCIMAQALLLPISAHTQQYEECTEELLISYYPKAFVEQTLDRFQVAKSQREAITNALSAKDQELIAIVEERAAKMTPNPLRDPSQRQEAIKIFKDTLYELFADVMQKHGINDKEQIQAMLDDIQQQKAKKFAQCLEKKQREGANEAAHLRRQPLSRLSQGPTPDYGSYESQEIDNDENENENDNDDEEDEDDDNNEQNPYQ